jgi:nicotinate-nucleotide adenylyltransferase
MNIGLYFGSFNPVHTGHLIIANYALNETSLERIWFVVSPQNPFKNDHALLQARKRLALVKRSISGDERFSVSDVEFHLSKPSFTINTLHHLKSVHPEHTFSIIMGSDSFQSIDRWKDFQSIIGDYKIFIFRRQGFEVDNNIGADIEILDAPVIDISSTEIRELIKKGKSIRYLVPEKVRREIEKKEFYKK